MEELQRKAWLKRDTEAAAKLNKSYEVYAAPVQETFDSVVAGSMNLLRNVTLDHRVAIMKQRYARKAKAKTDLKGGQFSALKSMGRDEKRGLNI